MKKIFLTIMLVILLVGTVSAFNFDNVKRYDESTRAVTFENAFGLGDDIIQVTLKSKQHELVEVGLDRKVSEMEWIVFKDSSNVFVDMEFFDIDNNLRGFGKNFIHKQKVILGTEEVPVYRPSCRIVRGDDGKDTQSCIQVIDHYEPQNIYEWIPIDISQELKAGTYTIGIFTDVQKGESTEWIPTYLGVRVEEWAAFSDSQKVGLWTYFGFNQPSGTNVINNITTHVNGTILGALQDWKSGDECQLSGCLGFSNTSVDTNNNSGQETLAVSVWFNSTWSINASSVKEKIIRLEDIDEGGIQVGLSTGTLTNEIIVIGEEQGGSWKSGFCDASFNIEVGWHNAIFNWNASTSTYDMYLDNVSQTLCTSGTPRIIDLTNITIGSANRGAASNNFTGTLDDIAIWNRSLTTLEISNIWANDTFDGVTAVGTTNITVSLNLPLNGVTFTGENNITFNATINPIPDSSTTNITNGTLFVYFSNGTIFNQTVNTVTGNTSNSTEFLNVPAPTIAGTYNWNVFGCGLNHTSQTLCNFASSNRSFDIVPFNVTGESFNFSAFETQNERFRINISTVSTVLSISPNLIYNGTVHEGTSVCDSDGDCQIEALIDIPIIRPLDSISQNLSFLWQITVFDSESTTAISFNTTSNQQNITRIRFDRQNANFLEPLSVNFTIRDENNQSIIVGDFEGSFDYFLGLGNVIKNNFTSASSVHGINYVITPNRSFNVNSFIDINGIDYAPRHFDFIESYNSTTTNQSLYLLNSSASTDVIVEFRDQSLVPLEGYIIKIFRFMPSIGEEILVENQLTDEFGQIVAKLVENDVQYRFEFLLDGEIKKSTGDITVACRSSICILPFVLEETTDAFTSLGNLTSYSFEFSFNNNTNTFLFSWDDNREESQTHRLEVARTAINGTTLICNVTSTFDLGVLSCPVGSSISSYSGNVYRVVGEFEKRIATISVKVGDPFGIFGLEGLLWSFILLMTMIAVGAFAPIAGVVLYIVGFLGLGVLGIISFSPSIFIANLTIVIVFAWAFSRSRTR